VARSDVRTAAARAASYEIAQFRDIVALPITLCAPNK
jgi:hypothetical protein